MLLQIGFVIYLALFFVFIVVLGLDTLRIGTQMKMNPKIITIMLPLFINFLLANYIFKAISPFFSTLIPCLLGYFLARRLEKVRIFGLTGGIATGKYTLLKQIRSNLKFVMIVDCDRVMKETVKRNQPNYKSIVDICGQKSSQIVNSQNKQILYENVLHGLSMDKPLRYKVIQKIQNSIIFGILKTIFFNILQKKNLMIINSSVLTKIKVLYYLCYPVIVVEAPKELQIQRLRKRDSLNYDNAKRKVQQSISLQQRKSKSHIYLNNQDSQQLLLNQFLTKINPYMQKNFDGSKAFKTAKK